MRGSVRALDGGRPPWRRSVRGRVPALARGRAPRGPSAVDAAAAAAAAPAQPAAEGVAGGRAASVPLRGASVVRAFDGRRGSLYSPRLSEGSATRAPGNGPWGSRGRRRRSAPPGRLPRDGKARRVGAGSVEIYLLERDILVVQVDGGRGSRRCGRGRGNGGCGGGGAALTLAHELDLVHDDLELGAALSVLLPRAVTQLALDRDLVALGEKAAHGLGTGAEHGAVHEVWVVLPLAGLRVAAAVVHGDAEGEHLRAPCGDAQLGVSGEVAGDADAVDAHFDNPFIGCWRLRRAGTSRRPGHC